MVPENHDAALTCEAEEALWQAVFTAAYRARNLIERAVCRLKDWRAIATRYDKTAYNFLAGVCLTVAGSDWLQ